MPGLFNSTFGFPRRSEVGSTLLIVAAVLFGFGIIVSCGADEGAGFVGCTQAVVACSLLASFLGRGKDGGCNWLNLVLGAAYAGMAGFWLLVAAVRCPVARAEEDPNRCCCYYVVGPTVVGMTVGALVGSGSPKGSGEGAMVSLALAVGPSFILVLALPVMEEKAKAKAVAEGRAGRRRRDDRPPNVARPSAPPPPPHSRIWDGEVVDVEAPPKASAVSPPTPVLAEPLFATAVSATHPDIQASSAR